jgi:hypothetical protein
MSGPQVIEVVVIDSDINDTDEAKGEPDVTVNGKILRMVQAVDGNWYGYFADRNMAQIADQTSADAGALGQGLDFGTFCNQDDDALNGAFVVDMSDTDGFAIADGAGAGGVQGTADISAAALDCSVASTDDNQNVLREEKAENSGTAANVERGQIGLAANAWPFIQLYNLNPSGNVVVQYNKGGGAQSVTLTFDTVDDLVSGSLDKAVYPQGAQVHATISDLWLNIDPTDEDSWTFGTVTEISTNYQIFDENGEQPGTVQTDDLTIALPNLMCEDNCVLELNPDVQDKGDVVDLQDNTDSDITDTDDTVQDPTDWEVTGGNLLNGFVPITFTEQGPNSGVFGSYDESDDSNIVITDNAARGTSASITYNEDSFTILVGHSFGSIDIMPLDDEWNSGEEIPVEVTDADANKNSRADEDLDLFNPDVALIPALTTGDPFSIGEVGTEANTAAKVVYATAVFTAGAGQNPVADPAVGDQHIANVTVQQFSQRALINSTSTTTVDTIIIDYATNVEDFKQTFLNGTDFHGFNLFNLDVRSLDTTGDWDVYLLTKDDTGSIIEGPSGNWNATGVTNSIELATAVESQELVLIDTATADAIAVLLFGEDAFTIGLALEHDVPFQDDANEAIVADFFSFGFTNDGLNNDERIANQLIRIEAEETGDNTSIFAGTLEYTMINQLNILNPDTYSELTTIGDEATFIVIEDLDDEESPRVNYRDLGADGVSTQVADQEEAPAHSGIVSFDLDTYKTADTVTIALEDSDLNVDSDLIDIYTTVTDDASELNDVVGEDTFSIELSNGDQLGRLLDVTFDDQLWTDGNEAACTDLLIADGIDTGLGATGFTLVETAPESGKFIGDFQIPSQWCREDSTVVESATGLDIEVNYVDFRDASGEVIEVGDSAGIRASTGSVSLDRTVYPVPFGVPSNFDGETPLVGHAPTSTTGVERSVFPVHQSGMQGPDDDPAFTNGLDAGEFLNKGDLLIHVRVNDQDFDISASGEDSIAQNVAGTALISPQVVKIQLHKT